jgi:PGF-CTERM protein
MYGSAMLEETNGTEELLNRTRTTLAARQAADLRTTYDWEIAYSSTLDTNEAGDSVGTTYDVSVSLGVDNENWAAYVTELQERGESVGSMAFEVEATSAGERIDAQAQVEVSQEEMIQTAIDSVAAQMQADPTVDEDTQQVVTALQDSEFEVARMDLDVQNQTVTLEAGAKVDSYGDFLPADMGYGIAGAVARTENDTSELTVLATGFVGENQSATAASLSTYDVVDAEETTVHAPGEWDRTFPTMDTKAAYEYLGLEAPASGSTGSETPGFTMGVALIALVGAALVVRRRVE